MWKKIEKLEKKLEKIGQRDKEVEKIKEIEKRMNDIVMKGERGKGKKEERELERRIRYVEGKIEENERKDRKKNIIIKRMKIGDVKKDVEEIMTKIEAKVEMKKIRRIDKVDKEEAMILVDIKK